METAPFMRGPFLDNQLLVELPALLDAVEALLLEG